MKKILFVATVFDHLSTFHIPHMKNLKKKKWSIDIMAGGEDRSFEYVDNKFYINIERNPYSFRNLKALRSAFSIINSQGYDVVYCHTAMGALIARLASINARKKGKTKVIYMAHGFHFYKGSPKLYWLIYYPIERFLSRYTDALITINSEDYNLVLKNNFKCMRSFKIDSIGVDPSRFFIPNDTEKEYLRIKHDINKDDFVLIYVAEFIHRKNHKFIIDSIYKLSLEIPEIKILFAGRGILAEQMQSYSQSLGIDKYIRFLGFRNDIPELLALSDIGISSSRQEGLGLNLIEELYSGLPVVASVDRGHCEIVQHGKNGYLFKQGNQNEFLFYITTLYKDAALRSSMAKYACNSVDRFKLNTAVTKVYDIIEEVSR